jgi:hypothetical protein
MRISLNRTAHVMADILNMESPLVNTVVKEIIILTGGMGKVRHKAGNPQGRIPVAREREEAKGGPLLKTNLLLSFLKLFMTLVHNRHSSVDKPHCPSLVEDNGKLCYLPLQDWQYVTDTWQVVNKDK